MEDHILYEDTDIVAIDKPPGMMVHYDAHHKEETVADWFAKYWPESKRVGEPLTLQNGEVIDRPGVVHRLDRETSGILVLAKHEDAHAHLKQQFHDRKVEKEYRAFVYGNLKEEEGEIDRPIGRSAKDFRLRSAQRGAKGTMRDAVTEWKLISKDEDHAYLAVFPKTGRTHQIRVHLKAISHPVVCDKLYAPKHECSLGFKRLALHAFRLTLMLPNGEKETLEAPLPADFIEAESMIDSVGK